MRDKSSAGGRGGLTREIKIPQQDFALKMPWGAYARGRGGGGVFAGTLRYYFSLFDASVKMMQLLDIAAQ